MTRIRSSVAIAASEVTLPETVQEHLITKNPNVVDLMTMTASGVAVER